MKMKTILKNQKGASAVEFALILPLLSLVIFGIIEFGLLLYNQQVIANASREGARAGIIVGLDRSACEHETAGQTAAANYCSNHLVTFSDNSTPLSISTPPPSAAISGDDFTVTVSYLYDFLVLSSLGFGPVTLDAKTIMKLE
jgi:Flp pilus assembly protein TadG